MPILLGQTLEEYRQNKLWRNGSIKMFITQKHIEKDGAPLQTEFPAPEQKDAKPISSNPAKRYKRAYGLQNFGIAKEGQTEL